MHEFTDLVDRSTAFTLGALREAAQRTAEALQTSGATSLVKTVQMITMQKAVLAVGMFSLFESILQDRLKCEDGFSEATTILGAHGHHELKVRFNDFQLAINALKHGRGKSYEALLAKAGALPFRVKLRNEEFFFEGDVSEISTLVEVDDKFVLGCAGVIQEVTAAIKLVRSDFVG